MNIILNCFLASWRTGPRRPTKKLSRRSYKTVHHSHSPGVVELNSMQFWHLHDVALFGRSYGCAY